MLGRQEAMKQGWVFKSLSLSDQNKKKDKTSAQREIRGGLQ